MGWWVLLYEAVSSPENLARIETVDEMKTMLQGCADVHRSFQHFPRKFKLGDVGDSCRVPTELHGLMDKAVERLDALLTSCTKWADDYVTALLADITAKVEDCKLKKLLDATVNLSHPD